ncbi:uncharacterized protein LOC5504275 isoform X2 [Nematostella vectensis]|uniref:uncharacterized protein LOC5504275 isoform X2 n=1 Tax=Nematostella vectensis TaxID=45351 RepID=UPI0020777D36|nr:uncharacterized protein LOC5504275 isoform X2 [Nematostella vectensis]
MRVFALLVAFAIAGSEAAFLNSREKITQIDPPEPPPKAKSLLGLPLFGRANHKRQPPVTQIDPPEPPPKAKSLLGLPLFGRANHKRQPPVTQIDPPEPPPKAKSLLGLPLFGRANHKRQPPVTQIDPPEPPPKAKSLLGLPLFGRANHKRQPPVTQIDPPEPPPKERNFKGPVKRAALEDNGVDRWPTSTVNGKKVVEIPYTVTGLSAAHQNAIERAVAELNSRTCIRLVARNNENDYVKIDGSQNGCSTLIGRQGGEQTMILGSGCQYKGKVIHEVMHSLGFLHEQCRTDRDSYIQVHPERMVSGKSNNFEKIGSSVVIVSEYDYNSLLHYSKTTFASGSSPVMEATDNPDKPLGNKNHPSKLDLKRMNELYGCSEQNDNYENYIVTVITSNSWGAGTDALIYMELFDTNDQSATETDVATGGSEDDFEGGATEQFLVPFKDVGTPSKIRIRLVTTNSWGEAWYPSEVRVYYPRSSSTATFSTAQWMNAGSTYNLTVTTTK